MFVSWKVERVYGSSGVRPMVRFLNGGTNGIISIGGRDRNILRWEGCSRQHLPVVGHGRVLMRRVR
jgi:hypothetical protein